MQRCGGTNFVENFLSNNFYHEPFQPSRYYGHITKSFKDNHENKAETYNQLQETLANAPSIKHCIEVNIPMKLNDVLAEWSCNQPYTHIVLYRQTSWERLISLHFAKQTSAWGPKSASMIEMDKIELKKLRLKMGDISKLINHEKKCIFRMRKVLRRIIDLKVTPFVTTFEELYETEFVENKFSSLWNLLNLESDSAQKFDPKVVLEKFRSDGCQGTRPLYKMIPGVDLLRKYAPIHPSSDEMLRNL